MRVTVDGVEEIITKFRALAKMRAVRKMVRELTVEADNRIKPYPEKLNINKSWPSRWYERGYGPRWRRKDGSLGGRRTSETLGRRWSIKYRRGGLQGIVANNASYAHYVQSAAYQTKQHKRTGWTRDAQVVTKLREIVIRKFHILIGRDLDR